MPRKDHSLLGLASYYRQFIVISPKRPSDVILYDVNSSYNKIKVMNNGYKVKTVDTKLEFHAFECTTEHQEAVKALRNASLTALVQVGPT